MGKVRSATAMTAGLAAAILGLLIVAAGGVTIHHRDRASGAGRSSSSAVPVTAPGGGIALGNGTKVLSEPVDPLTIVVPDGWQSIDVDPVNLPATLRDLILRAPALAGVLDAEAKAATDGSIRLFAYSPTPQFAFLSVVSFASPGAVAPNDSSVAALDARLRTLKGATLTAHTVHLPLGPVLEIDSSAAVGAGHVITQYDIVVTSARTVAVLVVAQTTTATPPDYFAQMVTSLHIG